MKELSTEQKAKAYDEAIKKLRGLHDDYDSVSTLIDIKEELENIFPELCESEDEKIRKEIIEYLWDMANQTPLVKENLDCRKWISWLEKQGEQKHLDYPYIPGWRENRPDNKPQIKHSVLMLTTHGVAEGEWLGEEWCQYRWSCKVKDADVLYWLHLSDLESLEKEGEQKPAEWNEGDKKINGAIVFEDFNGGDGYYKVNLAYLNKKQVEKIEALVESWQNEDKMIR